jgi:hypothetical protein
MKYLYLQIFLIIICSCSNEQRNVNHDIQQSADNKKVQKRELTVSGELFHDVDINPIIISNSQICYFIMLKISNTGTESISFNQLGISFIPKDGTPLKQTISLQARKDDSSVDGNPLIIELRSGESKSFPGITSDGFTKDLLSHSGEGLLFSVTLLKDDNVVYGPLSCGLPDLKTLESLPNASDAISNPNKRGYQLVFK